MASIPIALLVALILYVNEIPDRRGDARAGKRTLPGPPLAEDGDRRLRGGGGGRLHRPRRGRRPRILPVTALLMLLTIPLAFRVSRGLAPNYENPYGLMAIMGVNVQLHLRAGLLLLLAYALVLVVGVVAPTLDLFVG